ncbi:MAG: fumarylacetoacetate hydrolase family protein [Planctomycetes bacterium]|nr:fumarylacetoacetate hydrolase family protein [Planctomycetota bacterium]
MVRSTCVAGLELPVGKIVCVGRNYAEHAREMGAELPEEPVLFLKPSTALLLNPTVIHLPSFSHDVHHEVELVLRVAKRLRRATVEEALTAVDGVAVGLDLTARDLQAKAKQAGLPWAVAKGFDGAAPISELSAVSSLAALALTTLGLQVNGVLRQQGSCAQMLWPLPHLLAFISTRFTLEPGDLVFTGTPSGVAALRPGDQVIALLDGVVRFSSIVAGAD